MKYGAVDRLLPSRETRAGATARARVASALVLVAGLSGLATIARDGDWSLGGNFRSPGSGSAAGVSARAAILGV